MPSADLRCLVRHRSRRVHIDRAACIGCGRCVAVCALRSLVLDDSGRVAFKTYARCASCSRCINVCPSNAITTQLM